jgi:PAS domain-containing protein
LLEEDQNRLSLVNCEQQSEQNFGFVVSTISLEDDQSLVAEAARAKAGLISNEVQSAAAGDNQAQAAAVQAEMAIPLVVGQSLKGILNVCSDQPHRFNTEDLRALTILARQIAIAVQNAQLYLKTQTALTEIAQSKNLLQKVLDATPDWIFIKDREHRFRMVNQSFAKKMNLNPIDFLGKTDIDIGIAEEVVKGNPDKGIRGFWADDIEVMTTGQMKVIDIEPVVSDGQTIYMNTNKVPLRDENNHIWGVLGYVHNITERIIAEQKLKESEAQFRELTENIQEVFWLRTNDKILYVSPD